MFLRITNHKFPRLTYQVIIIGLTWIILCSFFWFASRYPSLMLKTQNLGQALPNMAYTHELFSISEESFLWQVFLSSINWLDNMKVGMTFGILIGALINLTLYFYPLKVSSNLYLNSLKGALVGAPSGICVNCSVPAVCGLTRANGRIELALGFLFSSPNFNPVVVVMTFTALPASVGIIKYAILLFVILLVVPNIIRWLERDNPLVSKVADHGVCSIPNFEKTSDDRLYPILKELAMLYFRNVWMLLKPTLTIMVFASIMTSLLVLLVPWNSLLSEVSALHLGLSSLVSVFMPVPIALDVMFASQLHQQGVASGYVMMFAMTLGTFSIVPTIYLWREVSKLLSVFLFIFFLLAGFISGLVFSF